MAKATRAAIQAMTVAEAERSQNAGLKLGGSILKQLTFDWNSKDKYKKLRNFILQVKNMFQNNRMSQTKRVPIIKNLLGKQGLQLLESHTQAEQEVCNTEEGLFETFNKKLSHNKMRPSSLYNVAS